MILKATICAAAAAGFLALAAPGTAQAAMPVNAGLATTPATSADGNGMVQTVHWDRHRRHWRHHRWHRRHRVCWVKRRVHWRHGHRVVTRVRHCAWR